MKMDFQKNTLPAARITAFLAVLLLFVNYYLLLILNNFFSMTYSDTVPNGFIAMISLFSFLGVALGSIICPFFMPSKAIVCILIIVVPNVILRSLGADLWVSSLLARFFIHVLSGMLYPICLGVFLQSHLLGNSVPPGKNRTGKYGIFYFAIAVVGGIVIRHMYLLLLDTFDGTSNTLQAMNRTYNIITILMLLIGCFVIVCIMLQKQPVPVPENDSSRPVKTNWSIIVRLCGLAVVFRVLNAMMEMRLFPRLTYSMHSFDLHPIVMVIAIPLLALLAGRSINRFLKIFIPAAISIFILLPCLLFFNEYPHFLLFMEILVGILNNVMWVVFTFAIIEHYAGDFWFYALASSIHFTTLFTMVSPMTKPFIPDNTEFTILICGIAAILFIFLAIGIVFPKNQSGAVTGTAQTGFTAALADLFRQHKLTDAESEVAALVMEGLNNDEIAKRILRATITVKVHLVSIYKKCEVKNRAEFMAMVTNKHFFRNT